MATLNVLHDTNLRMVLDYAGVAVFAATGALAAARRGFDIVTFAFFAALTGIGGGTLRDLLIGAPVFWISNAGYVGVCIAAAGVVWALGERLQRFRSLLWLDALGLAAYCVVGASKAADWGAPPLVAVVMGVLSASFGGMLRDVLAGEPSVLLRKEIYVTAAVVGAGAFVLSRIAGAPDTASAIIGFAAAFVLRAGALLRGWTLPGFGGDELAVATATPAPVLPTISPSQELAPSPPEPSSAEPVVIAAPVSVEAASVEPPPKVRRPRVKAAAKPAPPASTEPAKRTRAPRKPKAEGA